MNIKKTREAILDSSIEIFNEKKTSKVSTVQIADYMGISPGNLYYYFHNKEEIVRCIWHERIMKDLDETRNHPLELSDGQDLVRMLIVLIDHISKYYFFYSEISTLLHNDDKLAEEMIEVKRNNLHNLYAFVQRICDDGLFELKDEHEMMWASDNINAMICKVFCGNFSFSLEIEDKSTRKEVFLVNILRNMKPYCTEACWTQVIQQLKDENVDLEHNTDLLVSQFVG